MNLVLFCLLFTAGRAILYMPSPYFDVEQLDSNEAANLDWLFIRDRRSPVAAAPVSPYVFSKSIGKGSEKSVSSSTDGNVVPFKSRLGRLPCYRKN